MDNSIFFENNLIVFLYTEHILIIRLYEIQPNLLYVHNFINKRILIHFWYSLKLLYFMNDKYMFTVYHRLSFVSDEF